MRQQKILFLRYNIWRILFSQFRESYLFNNQGLEYFKRKNRVFCSILIFFTTNWRWTRDCPLWGVGPTACFGLLIIFCLMEDDPHLHRLLEIKCASIGYDVKALEDTFFFIEDRSVELSTSVLIQWMKIVNLSADLVNLVWFLWVTNSNSPVEILTLGISPLGHTV